MTWIKSIRGRNMLGGVLLALALSGATTRSFGQAYSDNQSPIGDISNSNQDRTQETRRSDHFRVVFGHYSTDTGNGGMSCQIKYPSIKAQGSALYSTVAMTEAWIRRIVSNTRNCAMPPRIPTPSSIAI